MLNEAGIKSSSVFTINSLKFQTIYGLLHNNVSLRFSKPNTTNEVVCKLDGNKVFEQEHKHPPVYYGSFLGKIELQNSSVLIKRLQMNNTGHYILEFTDMDGVITKENISLIVLEPLARPKIACIVNDSVAFLSCDLNGTGSYTTEWKYQNSPVISNKTTGLYNEGDRLTIDNLERFPGKFICVVKQHIVKNQSHPFLATGCSATTETFRNYSLTISVIVIVVLLVVVVVLVALFFSRLRKQKKDNTENETERATQLLPGNKGASEDSLNKKEPDSCEPPDTESAQANLEELADQNGLVSNEPRKINEDGADAGDLNDSSECYNGEELKTGNQEARSSGCQ
ncbi:uncharacterized protein LOC144506488 isoform X2 [Mustelus asterias]